jgi:uncharacterized protein YutE (UPF0331/DUF86 family)
MTPGQVSKRVIADRMAWVERMVGEIRALPLDDEEAFFGDGRNAWAAESCLRRALEALLDLGRHILAKGLGQGVSEYKEIATRLREYEVLSDAEAALLLKMAGYRNRMVHFYHQISPRELYHICARDLGDVERVLQAFKRWAREHSAQLDDTL